MINAIKKLKLRLQFTGWLQYLLAVFFASVVLSLALISWGLHLGHIRDALIAIAMFLLSMTLFDISTVKYNIRPRERRPRRRDQDDIFKLMLSRRSCRSFQNRKLDQGDLSELLRHVARQNQLQGADLIGDKPVRFEYIAAPLTVWPVVGAQEFLVAIAPKEYSRKAVIDVGRNLQKIVMQATQMGLASCWIGPGADQACVIRHLGSRFNQDQDHVICVCAIGYKSLFKPLALRVMGLIQHNVRRSRCELFFADATLSQPLDTQNKALAVFDRNFEACRWSPSSFNGQSTRMVIRFDANNRPQFDFYAATHSRYYAAVALGIWCANWELGCEALGIDGYFEILSEEARSGRGIKNTANTAIYDVSWVNT